MYCGLLAAPPLLLYPLLDMLRYGARPLALSSVRPALQKGRILWMKT